METANNTLLWLIDSETVEESTLAIGVEWLSPSERMRCERFVRQERRRQFIVARTLLRLALNRMVGAAINQIHLCERPGNAPELRSPALPKLGFSISHSGAWVACAVSLESTIGLDIERVNCSRDVLELALQAFSESEVARLHSLEGRRRAEEFYRMWCLREAQIKLGETATGEYLFLRPDVYLALRTASPLAVPPQLTLVSFDVLLSDIGI